MTEQNEEQQRIEELIKNKDYETLFAERIEQSAQGHIDEYHGKAAKKLRSATEKDMLVLGAYLAYRATKRQEQVLKEQHEVNKRQEQILIDQHEVLKQMKTQSDTMTKHSKIMIVLTFVILAAMGLQIIIQLCK